MTEGITSLVVQHELTPAIWSMIKEMAPVIHQSRLFGVNSAEQAAAIMLKGYELGLSITASFELVQVVQGKPGLSPRGALALLLNHPAIKNVEVKRLVENGKFEGYECTIERINGFKHSARWTMTDARNAGLIKPDSGWANYPENMCQWRAIGFCADVAAPDVTAGMTNIMKMPEAYGVSLDQVGNIIDSQVIVNPVKNNQPAVSLESLIEKYDTPAVMAAMMEVTGGREPQSPAEWEQLEAMLEKANQPMSLTELREKFGVDAVMTANNGRMPGTIDECRAVTEKLTKVTA